MRRLCSDPTESSLEAFKRSHRHSVPTHRLNNYLKFLNELAAKGSASAHLFSTAVISGSSSAPNLKQMPQPPMQGTGESGWPDLMARISVTFLVFQLKLLCLASGLWRRCTTLCPCVSWTRSLATLPLPTSRLRLPLHPLARAWLPEAPGHLHCA